MSRMEIKLWLVGDCNGLRASQFLICPVSRRLVAVAMVFDGILWKRDLVTSMHVFVG
jgi:hypothetical protein